MNDVEFEQLKEDFKELFKENENKAKVIIMQDDIINKAIEYIKECEYHLVIQPQKLLEILGGNK